MPGGRPKKKLDIEQVEKLAGIGCTDEEIAVVMGVCRATISNKKKQDKEFLDAIKKGREKMKASIRRMQMSSAVGGNVTMMIWLGKQYLDQTDKRDIKQTGERVKKILLERVDRAPE